MAGHNSWKSFIFRRSIVVKIEEAIRQSGMNPPRNSQEMENHIFSRAKNKDEYLAYAARIILHMREMRERMIVRDQRTRG
ncbi:unnamed protein product [Diabrotica balteata]|uniref:Mediator of RNA polymerase II transcription subunit 15 n=1 Tax=Diabrotica balteata TaxID=107213 RepID=A0A9N9SLC5_DIABA|nr:unnamed protein product [Diabrotica balteata]